MTRYRAVSSRPGGLDTADSLIVDGDQDAVVGIVYDPDLAAAAARAFNAVTGGPHRAILVGSSSDPLVVDATASGYVAVRRDRDEVTIRLIRSDVETLHATLTRWLAETT